MKPGDEIRITGGRFAGRLGKVLRTWPKKQDTVLRLHDAQPGEPKVVKVGAGEVEPLSAIDQLARIALRRKRRGRRVA